MRGRIGAIALVLGFVGALGTSCDDEPAPPPFPSSAFPSPTGTVTGATGGVSGVTGATGATGTASGPTGALPSPGSGSGTLTEGRVSLQIAGDVALRATLTNLISGVVSPPPGGFALVWTAGGTDPTTVGIGGATTIGTQPTSSTLVLTIAAQSAAGLHSWTSTAGECDVTTRAATTARFAGSFTCRDLVSTDGRTVDLSGTFQATG